MFLLAFSQRIGYLAASQCFHEGTDVIMLTTNQIRKVNPQFFIFFLALSPCLCFHICPKYFSIRDVEVFK